MVLMPLEPLEITFLNHQAQKILLSRVDSLLWEQRGKFRTSTLLQSNARQGALPQGSVRESMRNAENDLRFGAMSPKGGAEKARKGEMICAARMKVVGDCRRWNLRISLVTSQKNAIASFGIQTP